jgi:hypothetical protein
MPALSVVPTSESLVICCILLHTLVLVLNFLMIWIHITSVSRVVLQGHELARLFLQFDIRDGHGVFHLTVDLRFLLDVIIDCLSRDHLVDPFQVSVKFKSLRDRFDSIALIKHFVHLRHSSIDV